jgi:hypothetical protein
MRIARTMTTASRVDVWRGPSLSMVDPCGDRGALQIEVTTNNRSNIVRGRKQSCAKARRTIFKSSTLQQINFCRLAVVSARRFAAR